MLVHCPNCGKPAGVPDDAGGKRALCPSCRQSFLVVSTAAQSPTPIRLPQILGLPPLVAVCGLMVTLCLFIFGSLLLAMSLTANRPSAVTSVGNTNPGAARPAPQQDQRPQEGQRPQPKLIEPPVIEATDLYAEWIADPIDSPRKYKGKVLRVRGRVDQVGKGGSGPPWLALTGTRQAGVVDDGLTAYFPKVDLSGIKAGLVVVFEGRCDGREGRFNTLYFRNCKLIESP